MAGIVWWEGNTQSNQAPPVPGSQIWLGLRSVVHRKGLAIHMLRSGSMAIFLTIRVLITAKSATTGAGT